MAELLRDRLLRSMISAAFFSWQNALIIGFCLILFAAGVTPFAGWNPAFWLIFGTIGVLLFVAVTVTDKGAQQRIVQQILTERYDPSLIENDQARRSLEKALEYFGAIQGLAATRNGASRIEFQNTLADIDKLVGLVFDLGKRIDQFEDNSIINRDRIQARRELDELQRRLKAESDQSVQAELQRSIDYKNIQLENLKALEANVKRADIQMSNTLTQLGTVYAQLQNIGSKSIDRGSTQRLQGEVHDLVMGLQDTLDAIDEVQSSRAG